MGIFSLAKTNNVISLEKELANKDLLYISYDTNIPSVRKGCYFSISIDHKGQIKTESSKNQMPDPSTIYVNLPISNDYKIDSLPYWPHYIELSPGQRYAYLSWLRNVESSIDTGYVFLYYYGLERQLLVGNFDKAFDEIIKLRNAHKNKSFQTYSENALIHGAIMRDRTDRLIDLHERTEISGYSNSLFMIAYNAGMNLGVPQIMLILQKVFPTAKKSIKENKELFNTCIEEVLLKRNNNASFVISGYDISKTKSKIETRFANYSFPTEIQKVEITDFYQCKNLMLDIELIAKTSYELYKEKKAATKSNKTPEEIKIALLKKNSARYKKLLSDKKITQEEFEVLTKNNI